MKRIISFLVVTAIIIVYFMPFLNIKASEVTYQEQCERAGALAIANTIITGNAEVIQFHNDEGFLERLGNALISEAEDDLVDFLHEYTDVVDYYMPWVNTVGQYGANLIIELGKEYEHNNPNYDTINDIHTVTDYFAGKCLAQMFSTMADTVVPQPDADFLNYINRINNCSDSGDNYLIDFFWKYNYYPTNDIHFIVNPASLSYIQSQNGYNNGGIITGFGSTGQVTASTILTVNINSYNNEYAYVVSGYNNVTNDVIRFGTNQQNWGWNAMSFSQSYIYGTINASNVTPPNVLLSGTGSLNDIFILLSNSMRNVNIYVNGVPWSIVNSDIDYPIEIPNSMTIYNQYPTTYNYPDDSRINIDGLVQLIKTAINDSDAITFQDLEPLIVDINGQQAIATYSVVRTDYDTLIYEQYPIYPSSKTNSLNFPSDILEDNIDNMKYITYDMGINAIPEDVLVIISGCGVLLLIGYLINRMLE